MENRTKIKAEKGAMYPLGLSRQGEWLQFTSIFENKKEVKLQLWEHGNKITEILLEQDCRWGDLYSVRIPAKGWDKVQYTYEVDGATILDPCARKIYIGQDGGIKGQPLSGEPDGFDWQDDQSPCISYREMLLYRLQVRGFTKHSASGVKHKGTFLGLCEKIPYLKELGVNAVLLMPCYEFEDQVTISAADPRFAKYPQAVVDNFWGYDCNCWYFSPKTGYSFNKKSPETEFCNTIMEFHKNNIEVIMEFSFQKGTNPYVITECLRYWAEAYHIDGVYLNDAVAPAQMIARDPVLSGLKLLYQFWPEQDENDNRIKRQDKDCRRLANYNNGFLAASRCFLKGDEGQARAFAEAFRKNSSQTAQINFLADNNGFTLYDVVSYNRKHNEANGENNFDGPQENFSWNCGVEGRTKKQVIMGLRERQRKNAMIMLFFSQGVPMLYAGDEFGNTQDGNNNAYCQDNKTGWVNWDRLKREEPFLEFVKKLSVFRREMPVFHNQRRLAGQDYLALGCPDISWHGERAWYPDFSRGSRLLGVLLNGAYAGKGCKSVYVVFNANWEDVTVGFPRPEQGQGWRLFLDTAKTEEYAKQRGKHEEKRDYYMKGRSVAVFISEQEPKKQRRRSQKADVKNTSVTDQKK